ncbi:DUF742 domain-containing protein [Streptomyces palmae]|uniref:DUF742 domain-containing protein n=1 Tax=Streptomyces palmae TaxID=1701085 RepID=A0A4Z0G6W9_9ACTN|nr:DUF742 domain-containing protein [Streptomyces palmae]TGA91853.1 DUF742 domain-containing protein [Streptomyces palmae]
MSGEPADGGTDRIGRRGGQWEGGPERLYVVSAGRGARAARPELDLVTLIVARGEPGPDCRPEQAAILHMCDYPLSVAEVSAYLRLPFSTVTVILAELLDSGRIEARAPLPAATLPDIEILEAVMHGLQNL